jgi:hypothetical protein
MIRHRSLIALALLVAGCSVSGGARAVDAPKAREALRTALDGWKKGDAPASLAPSLTVQDMEWLSGAKLVDYQLTGDGQDFGVNLHVPVTLTLRTTQGREVKKNVSYIVGTSPIVTVARALH